MTRTRDRLIVVTGFLTLSLALCEANATAQEVLKPGAQSTGPAAERLEQKVKAAAEATGAAVDRMEVFNGPVRTVHYFAVSASLGEQAHWHDLARAENELEFTNQLLAVRHQRAAQELLYDNMAARYTKSFWEKGLYPGTIVVYPDSTILINPHSAPAFARLDSLYAVNTIRFRGVRNSHPVLTGFYSLSAGKGSAPGLVPTYPYPSPSHAFADEASLKREVVRVLASQTAPVYAAQGSRSRAEPLSRAGSPEPVQGGPNLKKQGDVRLAENSGRVIEPLSEGQVVVTMNDGGRIQGMVVTEDSDRLVVDTGAVEAEIRKTQTATIMRPKPATAPAGN